MRTSPFVGTTPARTPRRFVHLCGTVMIAVVQAFLVALSVSVIVMVVAAIYVLTTGVRLALPGVAMWAESYRESLSVVFEPNAPALCAVLTVSVVACAVFFTRAAVARLAPGNETSMR